MWEFLDNYLELLEKDCPKGNRLADMRNRKKVFMRGMTIDISDCVLTKLLFGPNYEAPATTPKLEHYMLTAFSQRPWLSRIFTDDGNLS